MDRVYLAENELERERLKSLINRLSVEELSRPMPGGWTVSGVLAHLAFWDARVIHLLDLWESGTEPTAAVINRALVDEINDSAKPLCLALAPRAAADLALKMAEEADRRVAGMPEALVTKMLAVGQPFNLSRANHRREHLDEIEKVV